MEPLLRARSRAASLARIAALLPNPSFQRTCSIEPRQAGEFRRWASQAHLAYHLAALWHACASAQGVCHVSAR